MGRQRHVANGRRPSLGTGWGAGLLHSAQIVRHRREFVGGQIEHGKQPGKSKLTGCVNFPALHQVGHIQARLQIDDLAGKKSIVGLVAALHVAAVGSQEGRQPGFLQRHRPGFSQVVDAALAGVFAQNQPCPVQRAGQYPGRLRAASLRRLHLHTAPLLPQRGRCQRGHQHHRQHGGQYGSAVLCPKSQMPHWLPSTPGRSQSRVRVPVMAWPAERDSTRRTPSGVEGTALGAPSVADPALDSGLLQAPPR